MMGMETKVPPLVRRAQGFLHLTFHGATPTRELLFLLEGFTFNVLFMGLSEQAGRRKELAVRWASEEAGPGRSRSGQRGVARAGWAEGEGCSTPATSSACAARSTSHGVYPPVCLCLHRPPGSACSSSSVRPWLWPG